MVELADTQGLGPCGAIRAGSNPAGGTKKLHIIDPCPFCFGHVPRLSSAYAHCSQAPNGIRVDDVRFFREIVHGAVIF